MTASFRSEHFAPETAGWTDVVREFEDAWCSTSRPSLRPFLERVPPAVRSSLLRELLLRDWQLRADSGETPSADDYVAALPEFADEIRRISVDIPTINAPSESVADPSASTRLGPADGSTPALDGDHRKTSRPVLFGDYEILHQIGKGGMGVVYKARHRRLGRLAAIKVLRTGKLASGEEVARFAAEAQAAAQLDHPGIVPVFEVGEHEGQHFLALAFIEGESLSRRVQDGPLEPSEAARIVELAARAVQFSHEHGVIHRDLKPANILIAADGQPKVTDFGLAKLLDRDTGLTQTGQILGTPAYMPPEQAGESGAAVGPLADVYSLGATLYCLLTGRPPFQAATVVETLQQVIQQEPVPPRALNAAIPVDLETICLKTLQKEPAKRYASAAALADDLHRFQTGHPIVARPVTATERAVRWCRREPVKAGLVVTAASSLLIGTVATSVFAWQASDRAGIAETALGRETSALIQAKQDADAARRAENAAEAQRKLAAEAAGQARAAEDAARKQADYNAQLLYDSDMQYVQQAWERGELPEIRTRLARHTPKEGEKDRRNFEWYYWDRLSRPQAPIQFVPSPADNVTSPSSALMLHDGRTVIGVLENRRLATWTVAEKDGKDYATFHKKFYTHPDAVTVMRLSPDGTLLATGDRAGNVKVWDAVHQIELLTMEPPPHFNVGDLVFHPNSSQLAAVSGAATQAFPVKRVIAWNVLSGTRIFELLDTDKAGYGLLRTVRFSPSTDEVLLLFGQSASLWAYQERRHLCKFVLPAWEPHSTFAFAKNSALVVGLGSRDQLTVWDSRSGLQLTTLSAEGPANQESQGLSVSPDGLRVAVAQSGRLCRIWNLNRSLLTSTFRGLHFAEGDSEGRRAKIGALHREYDDIWSDTPTRQPEYRDLRLTTLNNILAIDSEGSNLVADSEREFAILIGGPTFEERVSLMPRLPTDAFNITRVRFDSSDRYLGIGMDDGSVIVFDVASRSRLPAKIQHEDACHDIAFIPNTSWIASCSEARDIRVWDFVENREVATLKGHTTRDHFLRLEWNTLHPDQAVPIQEPPLAPKAGSVPAVTNFSTRTQQIRYHPTITGAVLKVAANPVRRELASVGGDGTLRVWNVDTQREIWRTSSPMGNQFHGVAFDPQGNRLAASTSVGISLWDAKTHEPMSEIAGHTGAILEIAFSKDGRRLVSTGIDTAIRLWDVDTLQQIVRFAAPQRTISPAAVLSPQFDRTGRCLIAGGTLNTSPFSPRAGISGLLRIWSADDKSPYTRSNALSEIDQPIDKQTRIEETVAGPTLQSALADALKLPAVVGTADGVKLRRIGNGRQWLSPGYDVLISRPFYLGETEVTVAQFRKFVEATGYVTDAERFGGDLRIPKGMQRKGKDLNWRTPGFQQADDHPVVQVSWNDARAFCDWLTKTDGVKHRLPTEAEWEWASRAGSESRWAFGFDEKQLSEYGWYSKNCREDLRTRPVGKLKPNAWGLHDMYGNVSEWVSDYVGDLPRGTFVDPQGPASHPERGHLARGGAFDSEALGCSPRSYGWSWWGGETFAVYHFGFRVLREIPLPAETPKAKSN